MTTATRQEVLGLYRRIFRLARKWQASSGQMEDTIKEKEYILNEARTLFQKNKNVSRPQLESERRAVSCICSFLVCPKWRGRSSISHSGRVWAGREGAGGLADGKQSPAQGSLFTHCRSWSSRQVAVSPGDPTSQVTGVRPVRVVRGSTVRHTMCCRRTLPQEVGRSILVFNL